MEEINLGAEIKRLEAMYKQYRGLYRRVKFICFSSETKRLKEEKHTLQQ